MPNPDVLLRSDFIQNEVHVASSRDAFANLCWRMLTYADVCWRMLTYADVGGCGIIARRVCQSVQHGSHHRGARRARGHHSASQGRRKRGCRRSCRQSYGLYGSAGHGQDHGIPLFLLLNSCALNIVMNSKCGLTFLACKSTDDKFETYLQLFIYSDISSSFFKKIQKPRWQASSENS